MTLKKVEEEIEVIIKEVEQEKGKNLLKHFVERAFESDIVAIALLNKLFPDLECIA